jgi:hypothetical protein
MSEHGTVERHAALLRAWHLAILRLALTRDNADRLNVLALANEIDRLGRRREGRRGFRFFQRTSTELCAAMLRQQADDDVMLDRYAARIEDTRLRRAFKAALGMPRQKPEPASKRVGSNRDLWRGLPSRGIARS